MSVNSSDNSMPVNMAQGDLSKTNIKQNKNSGMSGKMTGDPVSILKADNKDTVSKMTTMKNAVPKSFKTAKKNYLKEIDKMKDKIEKTLNNGFKQVYLTVAISSIIALFVLLLYRKKQIQV
jgi:hypothetical protein